MFLRFTGDPPRTTPRERRKLTGENITQADVRAILRTDAIVQTENGEVGLRTHLRGISVPRWRWRDDLSRHLIVYRCVGCGRDTCACNGSDDDPRCDRCVVLGRGRGRGNAETESARAGG